MCYSFYVNKMYLMTGARGSLVDERVLEVTLCSKAHGVTLGILHRSNKLEQHSCAEVCVDTCVAALCGCLGSRPANPNTEGSEPSSIFLTLR